MRDLLKSLTKLSEGDVVHKGEYGNKYGKEDVRDQYGHKIGRRDKGEEAKKEAPKKGRGRPKKDTGETGAKFDSSELNNVFGGKKPKKEVGKVSKKHSLKEYMESVEDTKQAETILEGMFGDTVDHTSVANNLAKLAKVIKSVQTPEQFAVAQKYAQRMSGAIQQHQHGNMGFGSGLRANIGVSRDIQNDLKAKAAELGINYQPLEEEGEALTVKPMPGASQILDPEGNTIGTADAQTANTLKQAADQGKLNLGGVQTKMTEAKKKKPDFLDVDKDGDEKESFKKAVKDKKKVDESRDQTASEYLDEKVAKILAREKPGMDTVRSNDAFYAAIYNELIACGLTPKAARYKVSYDEDFISDVASAYNHYQKNPALDEGDINPRDSASIRMNTQHALAEPTSNFTTPGAKPGSMTAPRGAKTQINRPAPEPTPWGRDPIAAATDRAFNFVSSLGKGTKFTKESTDMKDIQVEGWAKQLQNILNEGLTVSSSTGQQGQPNTVTVSATEGDADQLMQVLRSAGIGGFGAEPEAPEIGYGVAQGGEEEPTGTGTEPQQSPDVVGDDGDMLDMIKKMAGLGGGDAEVVTIGGDEGGEDYKDEEGSDDQGGEEQAQTLEPAQGGEEGSEEQDSGEESDEESDDEEETNEGNDGNLANNAKPYDKVTQGDVVAGRLGHDEEGGDAEETCEGCGMQESQCSCDHEQVEENFANSANDPADQELMKLKALLSMGGDLHRMKSSQAMGNPVRVSESNTILDWKKLSGIK